MAKMTPAPGHTRFVLEVTKPTTESAVGVKMTADRGGGLISVLEAVPGSLAEAAGLKAGVLPTMATMAGQRLAKALFK